jgi:NTE family protein
MLEAHGIRPDLIVGTSAGSVVGALYAGGYNAADLESIALELETSTFRDVTFPNRGFVKGELLQDFINRKLDNRSIEQLEIPFAAVATDLGTGELIVFTQGNTGMAVRASSSIPGIFQPVRIREHDYVDGGLVSPLPVSVARNMGADIVVAVDISLKPRDSLALESTIDVLRQSIAIMTNLIAAHQTAEADIVISPSLHLSGLQGFDEKESAITAGERATEQVLPQLGLLLGKKIVLKSHH